MCLNKGWMFLTCNEVFKIRLKYTHVKNTMKTTFSFNFDFYQVLKQHTSYTSKWKQIEAVN